MLGKKVHNAVWQTLLLFTILGNQETTNTDKLHVELEVDHIIQTKDGCAASYTVNHCWHNITNMITSLYTHAVMINHRLLCTHIAGCTYHFVKCLELSAVKIPNSSKIHFWIVSHTQAWPFFLPSAIQERDPYGVHTRRKSGDLCQIWFDTFED